MRNIYIYIYIYIYNITIEIFTSHKKNLRECLHPFNKENFTNCQATYQKELYLLFQTLGILYGVHIEIALTLPPSPQVRFLSLFKECMSLTF